MRQCDDHCAKRRSREGGTALLITLIILIALAFLGISSLESAMQDQQISGYQARGTLAFHAADAGLASAHAALEGASNPTIATVNLGDTALYPHGQPSYQPDPNVTDPVKDLGAVAAQGMNLRIGGGGPRYQVQYWRFNVQGSAQGGTISRVESVVGVLKGS